MIRADEIVGGKKKNEWEDFLPFEEIIASRHN